MSRRRGLGRFLESITGRAPVEEGARDDLGDAVLRNCAEAIVEGPAGPSAPNVFVVTAHFDDVSERETARWDLADLVTATAADRGWRLDGPVEVTFAVEAAPGKIEVQTAFEPGSIPPWGWLAAAGGKARLPIVPNRALVGRSKENDVVVSDASVSRRHALLWREVGGHWIADLTSSNGTFVGGEPVYDVVPLSHGDTILFGEAAFELELA